MNVIIVESSGMDTTAQEARGTLVRLVFGHLAAEVVAAAARFELADLIGDGERTAAELAERTGTHPDAMGRLLRAMASLTLLTEVAPGAFRLAPAGALLRTDRPDSMHAFTRMFTDAALVRPWLRLEESVRTGQRVFDDEFGTDFFAYLDTRPELSALFNASMSQGTRLTAAQLPAAYDFSRFDTVVDVGGGDGTLIAAILRAHPGLRGILFDTTAGHAQAEATLRRTEVTDRCEVRSGDFFAAVPKGGDLYLIKSVVHDWDDQQAGTILGHVREVVPDHGRLLIIEPVLPETVDDSMPAVMYLSDLNMMVNLGGRERTRTDFEQLCHRAGFTLTSITPLPAPSAFCLIEAAPA
jgi:hypothetical protein